MAKELQAAQQKLSELPRQVETLTLSNRCASPSPPPSPPSPYLVPPTYCQPAFCLIARICSASAAGIAVRSTRDHCINCTMTRCLGATALPQQRAGCWLHAWCTAVVKVGARPRTNFLAWGCAHAARVGQPAGARPVGVGCPGPAVGRWAEALTGRGVRGRRRAGSWRRRWNRCGPTWRPPGQGARSSTRASWSCGRRAAWSSRCTNRCRRRRRRR